MNLRTSIAPELWESIASAYEAGNYGHAVLEATHHLTTVLRDRSGADGDGATLVGQALGGEAPKLRVNALQSESDRNVQKGIEQLLRGIYLAIRNPRSHEQFRDTQQDADAIVHFLDYVLRILNASKESFTTESLIRSAADPEFVESVRYAELMVAEIPPNRRGDALIALYASRRSFDPKRLRFLVAGLLAVLNEAQLAQYLSVVSEELKVATEDAAIRSSLQMLSPDLWPSIGEAPRLRIENKLLKEIRRGEVWAGGKMVGALGTWASSFVRSFTMRPEAVEVLLSKLEDTDGHDRHYVAKYFMHSLPGILLEEGEARRAVRAVAKAIRNGDPQLRDGLVANVRRYPAAWQAQLVEALRDVTDPANPAVVLADGSPLLSAPTADLEDDDLPF